MQIGIVMLENAALSEITASAAPYLNGIYNDPAYVKVTTYHSTCLPSYPNYMAVTCASNLGNCSDTVTSRTGLNNLFTQMQTAGHSWKAYEEGGSLAPTPFQVNAGGGSAWPYYALRHNPAQTYSQTKSSHNRVDFIDAKAADGVANTGLITDIANRSLPDFFFVAPNLVNDGHSPGSVTTADKWCSGNTTVSQSAKFQGLKALAAAMRNDGWLVVTFDSNGVTAPLYCLVMPGGTKSASTIADFTSNTGHFGLVKGIQDAFGLAHWTTTGGVGTLDARYTGNSPDAIITVFQSGGGGTTAPNAPTITTEPPSSDTNRTPTFAWHANDGGGATATASWGYKVDGAATYTTLPLATTTITLPTQSLGNHTFKISAFAADGTTHSSDTTYTWAIVSTATSAPTSFACNVGATGSHTTSTSVSFSWASGGADDVDYQFSLDGGAWTSTSGATTKNFTNVAVGTHTFQVRALNSSNTPSAAVPSSAYSWTIDSVVTPTARVIFGQTKLTGTPRSFDRTVFTSAGTALGRQVITSHTVYNWGDAVPTVSSSDEKWIHDQGGIPIINCLGRLLPSSVGQDFPNFNTSGTANDTGVTAIANGSYDTILKAWAQFSKDLGFDHFVRPWREMTNGAAACVWKTSTGPLFIAAWKRMYAIFKSTDDYADYNANVNPSHHISGTSINASNATMIWCPAVWSGDWTTWYPGDAYVDWCGTDFYSYDTAVTTTNNNGPQGGWHSFKEGVTPFYQQFNSQNGTKAKKPLIICETNAIVSTNTSRDRAAWFAAAQQNMDNDFPLISGWNLWVDNQWPDFNVAGSDEYITLANDPVMGLTSIPGSFTNDVALSITDPTSNITVNTSTYTLRGSVTGGAGLALTVNGTSVSIAAGADNSFTDNFGRTTSNGWGGTWTQESGPAAVASTDGSKAVITGLAAGATARFTAGKTISDANVTFNHTISANPVGGAYQHHFVFRRPDSTNGYHVMVYQDATTNNPVKVSLTKQVAGVTTSLLSATAISSGPTPGTQIWHRVKYVGPHIQVKVWSGLVTDEPGGAASDTNWLIDTTDNTFTSAGDISMSFFRAAGETTAINATLDSVTLTDLSPGVGGAGTFAYSVTLSPGANTYNFSATDTAGGTDNATRTITYQNLTSGAGNLPATDDGQTYQALSGQIYTVAQAQATSTSDWQAIADTYSVVSDTSPGTRLYPYADDIRSRNPDIWLGEYVKGTGIPTSVTGLPENWYAHTVARSSPSFGPTTRLHLSGSNAHWMAQPDGTGSWTDTSGSVGSTGHVYNSYKEYHAAEVTSGIAALNARYSGSTPFGAAFLDSLGVGNFNGQVDPIAGTPYANNKQAWYDIVNAMVQYIVSTDSADLIETNGVDTNPGLGTVSEVSMIEGWMFSQGGSTNTPSTRPTPTQIRNVINTAINAQDAGCYVHVLDYTRDATGQTGWTNATASQMNEAAQLILAAYFLANQGKFLVEWSTQDILTGGVKPWNANRTAYWGTFLFAPRDTQTQLGTAVGQGYCIATGVGSNNGNVYRRRYLRGVVYLNEGNTSVAVTLDRADYQEQGSATLLTSPYTLPPQSGTILVAAGNPSAGINAIPPFPAITGTETEGATLTCSPGSYNDDSGNPVTPTSISYNWQYANDDGSGNPAGAWFFVGGPAISTLVIPHAQVGTHVRCIVDAVDSSGNHAATTSNVTGVIAAASTNPPVILAAPVVTPSGVSPQPGDVLSSTPGTFSGATSQTIRWQRGDDLSGSYTDIGAATSNTYTVQNADVGFQLHSIAKATNSGGSTEAASNSSLVVTLTVTPPTNVTLPTITGDPIIGQTLQGDKGTWTGDDLNFDYQWQRR